MQENWNGLSKTTPQQPLLSRILKFFSDRGGKDRGFQARLFSSGTDLVHASKCYEVSRNQRPQPVLQPSGQSLTDG